VSRQHRSNVSPDTLDHGAVHDAGRLRHHCAMTDKRKNGTAGGTSGRASAGTRLPALSDGPSSPAAVGRHAKWMQDLIEQQKEVDRAVRTWAGRLNEGAAGRTGLLAIEMLRMLALRCVIHLGEREEPVTAEEIASLALTLRRIEDADRLRRKRERTAADAAAGAAQAGGLSPETVFAIRRAAEGKRH